MTFADLTPLGGARRTRPFMRLVLIGSTLLAAALPCAAADSELAAEVRQLIERPAGDGRASTIRMFGVRASLGF